MTDGTTSKQEPETIGAVDHTPRRGGPGASQVYERGGEGDTENSNRDNAQTA